MYRIPDKRLGGHLGIDQDRPLETGTIVTAHRKLWRITARRAGGLVMLFAIVGLALSLFMSLAKFRSSYHCDESLLSACSAGAYLSCDRILASDWSTVGWSETDAYPITLFGSAFYAALLGLATPLLGRRTHEVSKSLLLYFAWAGVLICLPLGYYAYVVVGGICLYCTSLYLVNLAILLSVLLLDSSGQGHQFRVLWRSKTQRASTLLLSSLFFLAATMVQMLVYRQAALEVGVEPRCIASVEGLPLSSLVHTSGPKGARASEEFALFVDLACEHCAAAFRDWSHVVDLWGGRFRLSVYPVAGDHECDPVGRFSSPSAQAHNSCQAATAVECLEGLAPGRGLAYVTALFKHRQQIRQSDRHDDVAFTTAHLLAVAASLGPEIAELREDLERCIKPTGNSDDGNPSLDRVIERSNAAANMRVHGLPATFLVFFDSQGAPLRLGIRLSGHKRYPNIDRTITLARDQVQEALAIHVPLDKGP